MDRNGLLSMLISLFCGVALRKESVDRNLRKKRIEAELCKSLSARRAWIEIFDVERLPEPSTVALRKESVDRNAVDPA